MKTLETSLFALALIVLCFFASSCMFFSVRPERVDTTRKSLYVWSASKVHLHDGSVVVFPKGFKMNKGVVSGENGLRYDLLRNRVGRVQSVSCDSIAYMQSYKDELLSGRLTSGVSATLLYALTVVILWASSMPDRHY